MPLSNKHILNEVFHRPWSIPKGQWKYYQEWNNALFLHWLVDKTELRKFVPDGLEIDLFEGEAWVSVVLFKMEKIRPWFLPPFAPVSNFGEINVRTYVKHGNKSGVYFLSIEGSKWLSCKLAKAISGLPYCKSAMKFTPNSYASKNVLKCDKVDCKVSIGSKITSKSALDAWLTERYALFQDINEKLYKFELHHLPWELNAVELSDFSIDYPRFDSLFNGKPHKIHYSKGVQVLAWGREEV